MGRNKKRSKKSRSKKTAVEDEEKEEEYEVETILDDELDDEGKASYLVKWKGYDEQTWEPETNLNCAELIANYHKSKKRVCAACNQPGGVARQCGTCDKPVHHFCSIEIASQLGLDDFWDGDYCSKQCAPNNHPAEEETKSADAGNILQQVDAMNAVQQCNEHPQDHSGQQTNSGGKTTAGPSRPKPVKRKRKSSNAEIDALNPQATVDSIFLGKLVAFCPTEEAWMESKKYAEVGASYLVGRVCRKKPKEKGQKKEDLYELLWIDTQFQSCVEHVPLDKVILGREKYNLIKQELASLSIGWKRLCRADTNEDDLPNVDIEELEEVLEHYDGKEDVPSSLAEIEDIRNMKFDPNVSIDAPPDLFKNQEGSLETRVKDEFVHLFQHSASASFFAYLPLSFWRQVLEETNKNLKKTAASYSSEGAFSLDELMVFLGILFYMTLVDKGEYANYWGDQVDSLVFDAPAVNLDRVMSLRRFKALRASLCFRFAPSGEEIRRDPAVRIRALLNVVKVTGPKYIDLGRNVAVDEASVACRSKFGRHMIVYNPVKPTGKYHFRMYVCCCSTSWIAVNLRLHGATDIESRLDSVVGSAVVRSLQTEMEKSSDMRKLVLEVVQPLFGSKRIVNMDNYYTSVQLLEALKMKGLYGRGTIRSNSKHFPKHVLLEKGKCTRGDMRMGVSAEYGTIAASWCDGSIVSLVSNADSSAKTTVTRLVERVQQRYVAPECLREYNINMQGVDRLDQLRGRFSIADGHSFQKWHKKLALALIDVARCNAFQTRQLVLKTPQNRLRDAHRTFVVELSRELMLGGWADAPSSKAMMYCFPSEESRAEGTDTPQKNRPSPRSMQTPGSSVKTTTRCIAVSSKQVYDDPSRKKRQCIVCRWEDRSWPTQITDFCMEHRVCLCKVVYDYDVKKYMCPNKELTCWQKFHDFYVGAQLFSAKGNIRKGTRIYAWKQEAKRAAQEASISFEELLGPAIETPTPSVDESARSVEWPASEYQTPRLQTSSIHTPCSFEEPSFTSSVSTDFGGASLHQGSGNTPRAARRDLGFDSVA